MDIFIYSPPYNENSGGTIVLHRLCHIINKLQLASAYLVPANPASYGKFNLNKMKEICLFYLKKKKYHTNNNWNTPVWKCSSFPAESVVIYPEITNGNPLKIKNVVRWMLHQPGFHTNVIKYGEGELFFKFNSAIKDFNFEGSKLSQTELKVIYYPVDIYQLKEDSLHTRDIEHCYLVRKGADKDKVHNPDAVKIDGLSHIEIANIFKRSKYFISYDDYTAYSIFAILSGCNVIVVPGEGRSIDDWYPNLEDRYGIAYGFDSQQQKWASETKNKVITYVLNEHEKSDCNVSDCILEIKKYFGYC